MGDSYEGDGAQEDVGDAFEEWGVITNKNWVLSSLGEKSPHASLVRFYRDSPKRTNLD